MKLINFGMCLFLWHSQSVLANELKQESLAVQEGSTEFTAIGRPAMIRIKGEGPAPEGELLFANGSFSGKLFLDLEKLKTGIDLRDTHMKEKYLEVKKYPRAELVITKCEIALKQGDASLKDTPFSGVLRLHGIDHPVDGKFDVEKKNREVRGVVQFAIPLSDYKIDIPTYMGIKVSDHVDIMVRLRLQVPDSSLQ